MKQAPRPEPAQETVVNFTAEDLANQLQELHRLDARDAEHFAAGAQSGRNVHYRGWASVLEDGQTLQLRHAHSRFQCLGLPSIPRATWHIDPVALEARAVRRSVRR